MLHKETVTAGTLDLIHRPMADEKLKDFNLVGGTALALMLGHRISIDNDLFTDKKFNGDQLRNHLDQHYKAEFKSVRDNAITGFIQDVKFDLIVHPYPKIMPGISPEGIRMESLFDIAAMKINAIVGNGSRIKPRKGDFRDLKYNLEKPVLSFILKFHQDHFSLVAIVTVDGNVLQLKYKPHLFVFDEDTESCYLMASVQDDNLLMWILSNNKRLTVLKQDFVEFHNTFLAKVSSNYSVLFTNPESKKTISYSFENIANEILTG